MKKTQDRRAYNTLVEKPESFTIVDEKGKKKTLYLYPLQLGRLMLISQRLLELDIVLSDNLDNEVKKMWKICAEQPQTIAEIIAIATLKTQQEIEEHLEERTKLLLNSPTMTPNAIANVLMAIIFQSYYADFTQAIRSVKTFQVMITPTTEMERIASTEEDQFGGK